MPHHILFIDDEKNVLLAFQRVLRQEFDISVADNADTALALMESSPSYAVVVCDMRMPGKDGVETLKRIAEISPDTVRIMLTGNADQATAIRAINEGDIFRFLTKPCPEDLLRATLRAAVSQHELITAERNLLEKTLFGSVRALMEVLSVAQPEAYGRATRARNWIKPLTKALGVKNAWEVEVAAMLCGIGLVSVPPEVLSKAERGGVLSGAERAIMDGVPEVAFRLINHIPRMQNVATIVRYQDRVFNAQDGDAVPPGARILHAVRDLAAAGLHDVPSVGMLGELERHADKYDPQVLAAIRTLWGNPSGQSAATRHHVTVDSLLPGDRLVTDIVFEGGKLLLSAGLTITAAQIERLRNLRRLERLKEPILVERTGSEASVAA